MSAYAIVNVNVRDPDAYAEYARGAKPSVERFGGRYLARGGEVEVREGSWSPSRLVLLEFPDLATARRWYESDEYAALRALRTKASDAEFVFVEGAAT